MSPSATKRRLLPLLGPAFVAAIAYVDPGNVAANITAGARYGYVLIWVLVSANLAAMLIQYLSAKIGLVTATSFPRLLGQKLGRFPRLAYWVQAEVVAAATDVAEVIGGALALHLLFGIPLLWGGVIIGSASMLHLILQGRGHQRFFEATIIALLLVITLGFLSGLLISHPDWSAVGAGLIPRFAGLDSVIVAASMLGATVMPHAVYLHSSLVNDRHGSAETRDSTQIHTLIRATRWDIIWALGLAGIVNIGLLLLAASALQGIEGTDTIEGAHSAISMALGPWVGGIFAVGLLASGLASTSVGAYAGSEIMKGLLHIKVPLLARRALTLLPALGILAVGVEPTWALVLSQVLLSFGIPFAIIPLVYLTAQKSVMGDYVNTRMTTAVACAVAVVIVALNIFLIAQIVVQGG